MLEGGQFLAVKIPVHEWQRAAGIWKGGGMGIIEGVCLHSGMPWMLKSANVIAMHQFNWEEAIQAAMPQRPATPSLWGTPKSGQA